MTVGSYWQLPARLFDDSEELAEWARAALATAQRAALKKREDTKITETYDEGNCVGKIKKAVGRKAIEA